MSKITERELAALDHCVKGHRVAMEALGKLLKDSLALDTFRVTIANLERAELKLLAEMDDLRAAITEREERIAALRALVNHREAEVTWRRFVGSHGDFCEHRIQWEFRDAELLAAAGRREDGTWEEGS